MKKGEKNVITFLSMKLQNKALRWLCIILALAAVMGAIAATTGVFKQPQEDEEEDEDEEPVEDVVVDPNVMLFADCETMDGWKRIKIGGVYIDDVITVHQTQGKSSIGGTLNGADYIYSERVFSLHYVPVAPVDISNMTHFVFDFFVENPSVFEWAAYTVEIGSVESFDQYEIQTSGLTFNGLKVGWNTIELDLSLFNDADGLFDPTNVVRMRMYNGGGGPSNCTGEICFDNFRFIKK